MSDSERAPVDGLTPRFSESRSAMHPEPGARHRLGVGSGALSTVLSVAPVWLEDGWTPQVCQEHSGENSTHCVWEKTARGGEGQNAAKSRNGDEGTQKRLGPEAGSPMPGDTQVSLRLRL